MTMCRLFQMIAVDVAFVYGYDKCCKQKEFLTKPIYTFFYLSKTKLKLTKELKNRSTKVIKGVL